jgi:hypothetical protein
MSDGHRRKIIRRECVSSKRRIALGKPGPWMKAKRGRGSTGVEVWKSSQKLSAQRSAVGSIVSLGRRLSLLNVFRWSA